MIIEKSEMVNRVGAILTDYEGDLTREPQDYFAARSMLVAETVLSAANELAFRDIVIRFHHQASPLYGFVTTTCLNVMPMIQAKSAKSSRHGKRARLFMNTSTK